MKHAPWMMMTALVLVLFSVALKPRVCLAADRNADFADTVSPFLKKHCIGCHGGDKPKGDLRLDLFANPTDMVKARKVWENVLVRVQDGDMPPDDRPQPSPVEVKAFVARAEGILSTLECVGPLNPGRVTMRRLNKLEYKNTIRDLLGIDFQPVDNFPSDDVGYGFDNIGDVLTLPPLLLEKYLDAANEIMDQAIATPEGVGSRMTVLLNETRTLASDGEVAVDYVAPEDGEYLIKIAAHADQAGKEFAKMGIKLDGKALKAVEIRSRGSNPTEFEQRVKIRAGKHRFSGSFLNDFYEPGNPDPRRRDRNLHIDSIKVGGPYGSSRMPAPTEIQKKLFAPSKGTLDLEGTRAVLKEFASRAFRRPATTDEVERLAQLTQKARKDGASSVKAMQIAMMAVLVSPHFLFKVEVIPWGSPRGSESIEPLNDYELATRLSYFLWNSMPDDELFALAKSNELHRDQVLEKQVQRMVHDPKSESFVKSFAGQWLQIQRLETLSFDKRRFPDFDNSVRSAMIRETELFFQAVMREDRPILDFIDGRFTFVNEKLAKHYGIPNVQGEEFRKVDFKDDRRGGLLTQGSILASTSNPNRTSPVKRGKYVLEQILGTPPPPPPPDVPALPEQRRNSEATVSLRQQLEKHRSNPNCATCHARMDPLGFGMENFDPVGAWRDQDGKFPIDSTGELPDGRKFQGPAELRKILLSQDERFRKCLTEKLLIYALGRGLEEQDLCVIKTIADTVKQNGDRFTRLLTEIVKSDPFRKRKLEAASKP